MSKVEGKCKAELREKEVGEKQREDNGRGKKVRIKISENSKGNERDTSKYTRERQRKELGHTGAELFFSSSAC